MDKDAVRKAIKAKRLAKKVTIADVAKTVGKKSDLCGGRTYREP